MKRLITVPAARGASDLDQARIDRAANPTTTRLYAEVRGRRELRLLPRPALLEKKATLLRALVPLRSITEDPPPGMTGREWRRDVETRDRLEGELAAAMWLLERS